MKKTLVILSTALLFVACGSQKKSSTSRNVADRQTNEQSTNSDLIGTWTGAATLSASASQSLTLEFEDSQLTVRLNCVTAGGISTITSTTSAELNSNGDYNIEGGIDININECSFVASPGVLINQSAIADSKFTLFNIEFTKLAE